MIYYFNNTYLLIGLSVFFLVSVIFLKVVKKKNNMYLLAFLIMYIYICKLIDLTQFPIYASEDMKAAMGGQNVWKEMNLIPFKSIIASFSTDVFFNIIMTLPLGFGIPYLVKCSWKKIFFTGIMAGLLCEIGQLSSALWAGFTFRHVNIDDIILNLLGTLLGYILFKVFCCVFRWSYDKLKLSPNALLAFLLDVCDKNANTSSK